MRKLLLALLGLLLPALVVGMILPTEFRVLRQIEIEAPPAEVHTLVGDLERWSEWSPWIEKDPTIVVNLGERTTGVGASQSWTSEQGDGELTFTASDPSTGIAYDMAFINDGERALATSEVQYLELVRDGEQGSHTRVSWTMDGDTATFAPPILSGYMTFLMNDWISSDFDLGLAKLKERVEAKD